MYYKKYDKCNIIFPMNRTTELFCPAPKMIEKAQFSILPYAEPKFFGPQRIRSFSDRPIDKKKFTNALKHLVTAAYNKTYHFIVIPRD